MIRASNNCTWYRSFPLQITKIPFLNHSNTKVSLHRTQYALTMSIPSSQSINADNARNRFLRYGEFDQIWRFCCQPKVVALTNWTFLLLNEIKPPTRWFCWIMWVDIWVDIVFTQSITINSQHRHIACCSFIHHIFLRWLWENSHFTLDYSSITVRLKQLFCSEYNSILLRTVGNM